MSNAAEVNRDTWKVIRVREYKRARGMCEGPCHRMLADRAIKAWDVIANPYIGEDDATQYVVVCRSCRTKADAPARVAEAKLTKAARAAQVTFPWGGRRRKRKAA